MGRFAKTVTVMKVRQLVHLFTCGTQEGLCFSCDTKLRWGLLDKT